MMEILVAVLAAACVVLALLLVRDRATSGAAAARLDTLGVQQERTERSVREQLVRGTRRIERRLLEVQESPAGEPTAGDADVVPVGAPE